MKKQELPLISFCMPVWGDHDTVEKAVDSIFDQDYPNIEVVLCVDGCEKSEIAVKRVVKKYAKANKPISALYFSKNLGACAARNAAAEEAHGKYLSFLPADAYLYPGVVRIWMKHLEDYPDYDFLYGGYKFLEQKLGKEDIKLLAKESGMDVKEYLSKSQLVQNPDGTYKGQPSFDYLSQPFDPYFLDTNNYIDGSFPITAEKFWEIGGWDTDIKSLQDWDLWLSVVKSGGKGIFVRDVFFATEFPHKGGLSDDSSNHWLERTDQIKEKHGIEYRKLCVTSLGAPFHGRRIAYMLDADFKEMPSFKPHKHEGVYLLGFFPSISDQCGSVFAGCKGKRIIHWIGSDIWQMQQMDLFHRKILLEFFDKNVDTHLCEARFTQDELKELGIDAKVVPIPPRWFYNKTPLPKKFTVGVYQPMTNKGFYLPELCKEVAALCPDIDFKFFGDNSEVGQQGNIEFTGQIENMKGFIKDCSAIMRLTIHDGLPLSVVEFLSAGRNAILNVPMKYTMQANVADPKIIAKGLNEMKKFPLNEKGARYWRKKCSHKKYKETMYELIKYNPKEYWEDRAEEWSEAADLDYSLPDKDKKVIKKWLKELKFNDVLDIGCGNGRMVEWFEDKDYTGIDISKKLIDISKKRFPGKVFKTMKVEEIESLGQNYDLIFSYTTLEHIVAKDWPEAVRVLKNSGKKLLLIEPTGFESVAHCHDHDYEKDFHIIKKKKLSDKMLYLIDLTK